VRSWPREYYKSNTVTALKNGQSINGFVLCNQVQDDGENDSIPGLEKCSAPGQLVINEVRQRESTLIQPVEQIENDIF